MDAPLIRWLLDIDVIPPDAEGLRLTWEWPWPGWIWALLVAGAVAYAGWSYSRLVGRRPARAALAGMRAAVVLLLLVVISGPMLELPRETVEQDWVLVLADRSESMTIADAGAGERRVSRDEQLREIIGDHEDVWARLEAEKRLVWLGFHYGAFALDAAPDGTGAALGEPTGRRTSLDTALEQALQRAAARPLTGVVVLSDGRTSEPPSRAILRRLQADAVNVFTVPLGSPEPLGDLAIRRVDAPRRAFVRDKVPVVVELDRLGSAVRRLGATVRLVDEITGEELDAVELAPGDVEDRLTLTAEPRFAGQATWQVVVDVDRPDLIPENNAKPIAIELIDRPLRVLYVEGYPRWEYRYVKNLLVREKSIESSVMLLSADRDFAQEGNVPITRLPRSPEELAQFDVVIIGDVPGSFFSPEQIEHVRDHVAERGAGLLWIGGPRHTPASYAGLVLSDLLPMRGPLAVPAAPIPVSMEPTPVAERLGVLRLVSGGETGWPRELSDPSYGWSRLRAAQRIETGRLKPTVEILAQSVQEVNGEPLPLVMHMRYGAGRVVYVATDEIWRWRFGRGEALPEQFWVQMTRMLGRESLFDADDQATLEINPRRLAADQAMTIDLRVHDTRLLDERRASVRAVLETEDGRPIAEPTLRRVEGAEAQFTATYLPDVAGTLVLRVDEPAFEGLDLRATVEVFLPDDELRRPETDHDLLRALAGATGGRTLAAAELRELPDLLRNRSVTTINPLTERIWDTPLAFILLLLAISAEWIGRKVLRLS